MKIFIFFFLNLLISLNTFAQDSPNFISDANPNSRSFIWHLTSASSSEFRKHFLGSCSTTPISQAAFFPGGSVFAGATLYSVNLVSPYQLFTVDTASGVHTLVANVTNVPPSMFNITGLAWDYTTGIMYASFTNLAASQIGRINLTTGVMTPIGSPQATAAGVVAIALSPDGTLFAADVVADNLYKFNKTTGVATLVGPMGSNVTDIQFDFSDSLAYTITNNQLLVSTAPGGGTVVCTFIGNTPVAFAIKPPSNIIGIIPQEIIPAEFFVEQNYPNPFNPITKIKFGLPKASNVKLIIYDVIGREILELVNEFKQENTYEVEFDGTNLPSGVYFYRLSAGENAVEKKMVLIK